MTTKWNCGHSGCGREASGSEMPPGWVEVFAALPEGDKKVLLCDAHAKQVAERKSLPISVSAFDKELEAGKNAMNSEPK